MELEKRTNGREGEKRDGLGISADAAVQNHVKMA